MRATAAIAARPRTNGTTRRRPTTAPVDHPSTRLADNKCKRIAESGADAVVLGDLGCMLNIEGRLRRRGDMKTRVLHVAEVLAGAGETN